jgi:hypothetical protein
VHGREHPPQPPWLPRKKAYLAGIAADDRSVLLVSASDKRAIVRDLRDAREGLWGRFSAPKVQILWYYRSLVTEYRGNSAHVSSLIDELDRTVTEMEVLAMRDPT